RAGAPRRHGVPDRPDDASWYRDSGERLGRPGERKRVRPGLDGSFEALFDEVAHDAFLLPVREVDPRVSRTSSTQCCTSTGQPPGSCSSAPPSGIAGEPGDLSIRG